MSVKPGENNPLDNNAQSFIERCRKLDKSVFEGSRDVFISRSPGRLDLMGGNDDYTGGLVFETTIREATFFAAQVRSDDQFVLHNPGVKNLGWQQTIRFSLSDLAVSTSEHDLEQFRAWINEDPNRSWFSYIVGNLFFLKLNYPSAVTHGLNMFMDSSIPLGKGVSSSAALEVASMKACAAAYGIRAEGIELAQWTQWVENTIALSASGVMDQYAVIMGDIDTFTPMICQPCTPLPPVRLPQGVRVWGIDSGVRHSVAGIEYEAARAATFMGYQLICEMEGLPVNLEDSGVLSRYTDPRWDGYLARLSPSEFRQKYEEALPLTLQGSDFLARHPGHYDPYTPVRPQVDYPVRYACRYAVEENQRVRLFHEILRSAALPVSDHTLETLGELMFGAHLGYTDCGLGSPVTDLLVEMVKQHRALGLFGAKITGGGAGGTVAILGRDTAEANAAVKDIFEKYRAKTGNEPYFFEGSSKGADAFGVVTIRIET